MKKVVITCMPLLMLGISYGQTLFTYGNNAVSKTEFLQAFSKNPGVGDNRKQALQEYLGLYINFKLKVKAAYDLKMQDDAVQVAELQNFRQQIADNVLNEEARLGALTEEAFNRSQKDIHLAQVLIEFPENGDTVQVYKKIQAAWQDLKAGKNFATVAAAYSTDDATRQAEGDLGFVTVFTLPYHFENVAYNTAPATYSAPFRSSLGYHIFKNQGERKPLGSLKVAQIFIAWPPNSTSVEKASAAAKADSVYNLLTTGTPFGDLARSVSNDMSSSSLGGVLPELSIGMYSPAFENVAYALQQPGAYSKPFTSEHGYHIVQLIEKLPVNTNRKNLDAMAVLQEKVKKDERLNEARKQMVAKQMKAIRFKQSPLNQKELWRFTDSMLTNRQDPTNAINSKTVLFSFAKDQVTCGDWVNYILGQRAASPNFKAVGYANLLKDFTEASATQYYRSHLQDYSADFRQQLQEFKDANLLFAIMDKNVWSRANSDSTGLKEYYSRNSNKYRWQASADALVITCNNDTIVNSLQQQLEQAPYNWRTVVESYRTQVSADSGRYELGQLQVVDRTHFQPKLITAPIKNEADNSVTFNYIFGLHDAGEPRIFDDAKGMIISDYQEVLEDKWIAELKKKYPVKVNMAVFNAIK